MFKKKTPKNAQEKDMCTLGTEQTLTLHKGRSEAIEWLNKCNLSEIDLAYFTNEARSLPEGAFIIQFRSVSIPWQPEEKIISKGGSRDQIKAEASYGTLMSCLVLVLAAAGKLKEPVVTLECIRNNDRLHVSVSERKENIVKKFLKVKSKRTVSARLLPYSIAKHNPAKVIFGTFKEAERVPPVKATAPEPSFQMAAM